jgi:shikimate dehydrogenase
MGAGATARSIVWHLMRKRFRRIGIVTGRLRAVKSLLQRSGSPGAKGVIVMEPRELGERRETWDVIVSTWPPDAVRLPMTKRMEKALGRKPVILDLNYGPGRDRLYRWALESGLDARDGRGFLLHQGALSFRMWTGSKPPLDVMRAALGLQDA